MREATQQVKDKVVPVLKWVPHHGNVLHSEGTAPHINLSM